MYTKIYLDKYWKKNNEKLKTIYQYMYTKKYLDKYCGKCISLCGHPMDMTFTLKVQVSA